MLDKISYTYQHDLRYLMTSEFTENHPPYIYKDLLFKFRSHYRSLDNEKTQLNRKLASEKEYIDKLEKENKELKNQRDLYIDRYNKIKYKKLSWKERIFGKIK